MWWQADAIALARLSDRVSTVYVERAVIGREQNAVTIIEGSGTVALPAATMACLLLGPGTKVTHPAMQLLADSGTAVCWVGEQGVRFYAHGVSTALSSRVLLRQAWLVSDPRRRVAVARAMYQMRFPGEDVTGLTMQQLRGREGVRVRRLYREHELRTGVAWHGRNYIPGQAFAAGDTVNRLLSALNAALYGIAHAAIVGVGASPGLGFEAAPGVYVGSASVRVRERLWETVRKRIGAGWAVLLEPDRDEQRWRVTTAGVPTRGVVTSPEACAAWSVVVRDGQTGTNVDACCRHGGTSTGVRPQPLRRVQAGIVGGRR